MQRVQSLFPQPSFSSSLSKLPWPFLGIPWALAAPLGAALARGSSEWCFPALQALCLQVRDPSAFGAALSTGNWCCPGLQVVFWVTSCARPSKNISSILIHSLFFHNFFHKALVVPLCHIYLSSPKASWPSPALEGPSLLQTVLGVLQSRAGTLCWPLTAPEPPGAVALGVI